jgi:hypothetical protein
MLHHHVSLDPCHKYLTMRCQKRRVGKGKRSKSVREDHGSWAFDVKFPLGTQFTFGSLTFTARKDGELRMLPPGPTPERRTPADGQAPWSLMTSSISDDVCSGLDPFAGLYIRTGKIV